MAIERQDIKKAAALAAAGDWHGAHTVVQQDERNPLACWLHACLHKIEGDEGNARYWYHRSGGRTFEAFADPVRELETILEALDG